MLPFFVVYNITVYKIISHLSGKQMETNKKEVYYKASRQRSNSSAIQCPKLE